MEALQATSAHAPKARLAAPAVVNRLAAGEVVGSDAWMTGVVRRYSGLVHSAARRRVGDGHLAEDVTQAVFLVLSRRARSAERSARRTGSLAGWLLTTTKHVSSNALRREQRRRRHERAAVLEKRTMRQDTAQSVGGLASSDPSEVLAWREVAPLVDDAVLSLSVSDRTAVLMRYFEARPVSDVASALGVSQAAAKQRVARALRRLRKKLERRGVELPAATLAGMLSAYAVSAAPAEVVVACVRVAGSAASVFSSGTAAAVLAKGTLTMMNTMKLTAVAAMVLATGATVGLVALAGGPEGGGLRTALSSGWVQSAGGSGAQPATQRSGGGLVLEGKVEPWPAGMTKPMGSPLSADEVPLDELLPMLAQRMGLTLYADWEALELEGVDRKTPVTLNLGAEVTAGRALELALHAVSGGFASLNFDWNEGVLMVSTEEVLSKNVRTMVIDLRPIAGSGPDQEVSEAVAQQIVETITETIHTDAWRDNGGSIGAIRAVEGRLVVTATPRMLRDVLALLEKFSERDGATAR